MKEQIIEIAEKLCLELITEDEAKEHLLHLFGVISAVCEHDFYTIINVAKLVESVKLRYVIFSKMTYKYQINEKRNII